MKAVLICILFIIDFRMFAQPPSIQWAKNYGGSQEDCFNSIINHNGIFYIIGSTESDDNDVVGHHNPSPGFYSNDVWLTSIDSNGNLLSNMCYGGRYGEIGNSIVNSLNSGFVMASSANEDDSDVIGIHNHSHDFWVININDTGTIIWAKCFGGDGDDDPTSVIQTTDSNYIIVGYSNSNDNDVTGNHGLDDLWVLKIDTMGNIIWSKSFGGQYNDFTSQYQTSAIKNNGNLLVIGNTWSWTGQVSGNHGGGDIWVIEIDTSGQLVTQKCFGGSQLDNGYAILAAGNGYYVAGTTNSNDGDVSNFIGGFDFWLAKVDSTNNIVWNKCYGGLFSEYANAMCYSNDGGLLLAGLNEGNDGQVTGFHGGHTDTWVVKVDSSGNFEWGKSLGGTGDETANCIIQTPNGGYLVGGSTTSNDGDVSNNYGNQDAWLVKLAPTGLAIHEPQYDVMELTVSHHSNEVKARFFSRIHDNAKLFIRDINGRVIFQKDILISEGINYQSISTLLLSGIYVLQIAGDGFSVSEFFVVDDKY